MNSCEKHKKTCLLNSKSGFTLVEIMVTTAIMVLILLMFYGIINANNKFWKKSESGMEVYGSARFVMDQIARDIRSAMVGNADMATTLYCYGNDDVLSPLYPIQNQSVKDEFFFIAAGRYADGESDLCEVGYWVTDSGDLRRYYRVSSIGYDFNVGSGTVEGVCSDVTDLQFEYWSGDGLDNDGDGDVDDNDAADTGSWVDEWDSSVSSNQTPGGYDDGRFPIMVKIMLTIKDSQIEKNFHAVVEADK